MKILQNNTIRVSDSRKTNDYSETQWIITGFKDFVINNIVNDKELNNIYGNYRLKYYFKSELENIIKNIFINNSKYIFSYVTCFTEEPDLLSQWRGYGDNGQGVSIGFDKDTLIEFSKDGLNFNFIKIIYDKNEQNYLMKFFSDVIEAYKQVQIDDNIDQLFFEFIQDIGSRISIIRSESPRFKNSAFLEEKEWRLIINNYLSNYNCGYENDDITTGDLEENYSSIASYNSGFIRSPLKFTYREDTIVPYFDLNFEKIKNKLIKKIYLGPKCTIDIIDLKLFLESFGYDIQSIDIEKSSATYR